MSKAKEMILHRVESFCDIYKSDKDFTIALYVHIDNITYTSKELHFEEITKNKEIIRKVRGIKRRFIPK
jgi:hypothetical protein